MHTIVCMPEVKRIGAFKIYFYSKEGNKPHVHVRHNSGVEVVIWLNDLEIKRSSGSKKVDKRAVDLVRPDQEYFLELWNDFFEDN